VVSKIIEKSIDVIGNFAHNYLYLMENKYWVSVDTM